MSYKVVEYGKQAKRRNYSRMYYDIELPYLLEMQTNSFKNFLEKDIEELLHEISPIEDSQGTMRLYFDKPIIESPKQ